MFQLSLSLVKSLVSGLHFDCRYPWHKKLFKWHPGSQIAIWSFCIYKLYFQEQINCVGQCIVCMINAHRVDDNNWEITFILIEIKPSQKGHQWPQLGDPWQTTTPSAKLLLTGVDILIGRYFSVLEVGETTFCRSQSHLPVVTGSDQRGLEDLWVLEILVSELLVSVSVLVSDEVVSTTTLILISWFKPPPPSGYWLSC